MHNKKLFGRPPGAAIAVGLALLPFLAPALPAQAVSGELTGAVQDAAGAVIPNAGVEAAADATGVRFTVRSGDFGTSEW